MKGLFIICLFINSYSFGQITKLIPGKIRPGFISLTRFDLSRAPVKEQPASDKGRIIQINIWYPSGGDTKNMSFGDYVKLAGKELDTSPANKNPGQKGIDKYFEWPVSAGADKKQINSFLDGSTPMNAHRDAKWLIKKYPLVMLVHGFAADYAYLAEWLAGNGYVVMQVPVKGTTTYELDYEANGLESQVTDYEFALKLIQSEFSISAEKAAVVGFSFGGQSAVALSLRNKNIKAIVSLDGGIGSAFGAQLLSRQTYYDSSRITAAILHMYNPADSYTDLAWFDKPTHTNRFLVAMKNMQHGHFTSFGLLNKIIPGIMGSSVPGPGDGYEAVMLLAKEFLDNCLQGKMTNAKLFFENQKKAYSWINDCIVKTEVKLYGS
jgi:dienelactone hydrolase